MEESEYGSEDRWPPKSEYATEPWTLAKRLRDMFGKEFIGGCVGLNAIFVRAHSMKNYSEQFDRALRAEIDIWAIIARLQHFGWVPALASRGVSA